MTYHVERNPRLGQRIAHLFRDCRVLSGKEYDLVTVPLEDREVPTCKGCISGSSVPGHPNELVR